MRTRSVFSAAAFCLVLGLATAAPTALSGEEVPDVADFDDDGEITDAERARYDWIEAQLKLDAQGVDSRAGLGADFELLIDAKYVPPEAWKKMKSGNGMGAYVVDKRQKRKIMFSDKKGPLPVDIWASADGFDRHVFTAEIRVDKQGNDDPLDDRYLIDVFDPSRDHGNATRGGKGETPTKEDFSRFRLEGETAAPTGKKRPKSSYGDAYLLVEGEDIKSGQAAVILSVGPHASNAYALVVSRTPKGLLEGQLFVERRFVVEQKQLSDEIAGAKVRVRAALQKQR